MGVPSRPHSTTGVKRSRPHNLNVLQRRYHAEFYETVAKVMALRASYLQERILFVKGSEMVAILKGLGARDEDFPLIQRISDSTGPDPTFEYRTVTAARYCLDSETRCIQRLEKRSPLSARAADEHYKRYDPGPQREFDEASMEVQGNTVVQALMLFKALVVHKVAVFPREKLDYASHQWVCSVFNVRIMTDDRQGVQGEPATGGVQSDGSDHTMTVLLGSSNMRSDSAVTYLHDNLETTGAPLWETNPALIRGRVQHRNFLDTLVFADHHYKRCVTQLNASDPSERAWRDMLVVFTRRPKLDEHGVGHTETQTLHATCPLQIPIWLP
ncbi:uncharacterized protein BP01DRAFT_380912 [Aspergillus saccharolyticus JOP 1030-1]|uniref:Uncharacterized protein n=1 Tax=Aspergillus saccharolyticus JOP 1030-1 TaxID=1450539 RepID=A0A318ZSY4_9EURO|nr:hypothetical protein BP01DRAFT_380912 [Aspergillus saccharolyticus JOP 1030-1]PYH47070.1 hypothetical protein BP01DRAFT_380912 [Aspergillus saccharolyticus JOP 1030-1]